jgi:hypothetical protein
LVGGEPLPASDICDMARDDCISDITPP